MSEISFKGLFEVIPNSSTPALKPEYLLEPGPAQDRAVVFEKVVVDLGGRSYPVVIGVNLLTDEVQFASSAGGHVAVIVTNDAVGCLYADMLSASLKKHYVHVMRIDLPDGERYKNLDTLNEIFDALLKEQCDRKTVLYALGGGVIGDVTGFAAATYMRGIPFIQVPTSLLAQVDSSVGGKTAVNHSRGKNMVGAFYQPALVVCDLNVLMTLPDREISAGLAEIIKYGPIFDTAFFNWIEKNISLLVARNINALSYAVRRSVQIKADVVSMDEKEGGVRAILNFGHTFGHAIESGLGYGAWLHGEAVGCGMVMAAKLSHALDLISSQFLDRLTQVVRDAGLPVVAPVLDPHQNASRYIELMRVDKKADHGEIRFVLINESGSAFVRTVPEPVLRQVIEQSCDAGHTFTP